MHLQRHQPVGTPRVSVCWQSAAFMASFHSAHRHTPANPMHRFAHTSPASYPRVSPHYRRRHILPALPNRLAPPCSSYARQLVSACAATAACAFTCSTRKEKQRQVRTSRSSNARRAARQSALIENAGPSTFALRGLAHALAVAQCVGARDNDGVGRKGWH